MHRFVVDYGIYIVVISSLSKMCCRLADSEKEQLYKSKADAEFEQYNELIDLATNERIEAEAVLLQVENKMLVDFGGGKILQNPFNYENLVKKNGENQRSIHPSKESGPIRPLLIIWSASTTAIIDSATGTILGGIVGSCLP